MPPKSQRRSNHFRSVASRIGGRSGRSAAAHPSLILQTFFSSLFLNFCPLFVPAPTEKDSQQIKAPTVIQDASIILVSNFDHLLHPLSSFSFLSLRFSFKFIHLFVSFLVKREISLLSSTYVLTSSSTPIPHFLSLLQNQLPLFLF